MTLSVSRAGAQGAWWYMVHKETANQFDLLLWHLDDLGLDAALLVRLRSTLLLAAEAQLLLAFSGCHLETKHET